MNGEMRRQEIMKRLSAADKPISASALATICGVSRQIIVQDVALLRAAGQEILSMPRGYLLKKKSVFRRSFKAFHSDEDVGRELSLIIELGGTVIDVFVYHRIYGVVRAPLNIQTPEDVDGFLAELASGQSSLLKNVTSGYHYHTVSASSEAELDEIEKALIGEGFMAPLRKYEPDGVQGNDKKEE